MTKAVLLLHFILFSFVGFAKEDPKSATYKQVNSCKEDLNDLFDPGLEIDFGSYKGKCLNVSTVRPPVITYLDNSVMEVANFYHDGRYWIARIPQDKVTSVMFQGVPFESYIFGLIKIAHAQLRFKLSQPIELRAQSGDTNLRDSVNDIIISSTATRPKGVAFNILKGKSFAITTRVLSTTARAVEEISEDKSDIHQYELKLSTHQMNRLLSITISEAARIGYSDRYSLLANNCSVKILDAVDVSFARPKGVKSFRGNLLQIRDIVETPALEELKLRNISHTQVNDLNSEVICALPGEKLGPMPVDENKVGAASALCRFKNEF